MLIVEHHAFLEEVQLGFVWRAVAVVGFSTHLLTHCRFLKLKLTHKWHSYSTVCLGLVRSQTHLGLEEKISKYEHVILSQQPLREKEKSCSRFSPAFRQQASDPDTHAWKE